jgi:hypothetical protein
MSSASIEAWVRGSCKFAVLESGFANIRDGDGKLLEVATEVPHDGIKRMLTRIYYDYGAARPGYEVFQTREQALLAAGGEEPSGSAPGGEVMARREGSCAWRKRAQAPLGRPGGNQWKYKGYVITRDPPPIPHRGSDWQFSHEDFDGAPDSMDPRHGTAGSLEDARRQIDELEVEGIYQELQPDADPMARMYDLRKKGPGMTDEESAELRGLIGRHGRPKFMSKDKVMTKQRWRDAT